MRFIYVIVNIDTLKSILKVDVKLSGSNEYAFSFPSRGRSTLSLYNVKEK